MLNRPIGAIEISIRSEGKKEGTRRQRQARQARRKMAWMDRMDLFGA